MVLLGWTALDLALPGLCALDSFRFVTNTVTAAVGQCDESLPSSEAPGHVDDCFCCSRCVEPTALPLVATIDPLRTPPPASAVHFPPGPSFPFDHPPQLLG